MTKPQRPHLAESHERYMSPSKRIKVTLDVHENGTTALVAQTLLGGSRWTYITHRITDPFDQDKQAADLQAFIKELT